MCPVPAQLLTTSALVQGLLSSEHACHQCHMIKKHVSADGVTHDLEGAVVHPDSEEGKARHLPVRPHPLLCVMLR
jgi:hypothetical protein